MTAAAGNGRRAAETPLGMTPLEMIRNLVRSVEACARAADADPLQAHVQHLGTRQAQCAETAAHLALVSIAEDVHALTAAIMDGRLLGSKSPWD
jgi:hypothetical protein